MDTSGGTSIEDQVYVGTWINWSRGKLYGSTLTLTARDGNFLVAFIALFVAFAGGSLYRILCFYMHLLWSSEKQNDAIHHQRQAILRNSESGLTATWALLKMIWQWKRRGAGNRPFRRLVPIMGVIITLALILLVAGVYSSEISAISGDEVLLHAANCGILQPPDPFNATIEGPSQLLGPYASYDTSRVQAFRSFAQDCYSGSDSINCKKLFSQTNLKKSMIVDKGWICPFKDEENKICWNRDEKRYQNMFLDSGLLDSSSDLGINAPPSKRVYFRQVMECGPLETSYFSGYRAYNVSEGSQKVGYREIYLGNTRNRNVTYKYPDNGRERISVEGSTNSAYYTLGIKTSARLAPFVSKFDPAPIIQRNDSDVMLAFLSQNNIQHLRECYDPWYRANMRWSVSKEFHKHHAHTATTFVAPYAITVMGCALRYQTCLPSLDGKGEKRCSQLGPSDVGQDDIPQRSEEELQRMQWIRRAVVSKYSLPYLVERLGQDSLTSRFGLSLGLQSPLPDDQWKSDVQRWFEISLASMQMAAVDAARGPGNRQLLPLQIQPQNSVETSICSSQKIRSTAHSNFSIFGLIIIFVLGTFIILVHWSLEPLHRRWLWRLCRSREYSSVEWTANGVLQLQRLAHEGAGSGTWQYCDDNCPVTVGHGTLTTLDISDPAHPKLRSKGASSSQVSAISSIYEQVIVGGPGGATRIRLEGNGPHILVLENKN